jgi:hypothetical protein
MITCSTAAAWQPGQAVREVQQQPGGVHGQGERGGQFVRQVVSEAAPGPGDDLGLAAAGQLSDYPQLARGTPGLHPSLRPQNADQLIVGEPSQPARPCVPDVVG